MKIEIIDKIKLILAEEGEVLTEFDVNDDVSNYTSFKKMITNINYDTENIRVITEEENEYFEKLKIEREKEIRKNEI